MVELEGSIEAVFGRGPHATYPTPNKKHDVPLWVYIAADISMRFHGVHSFNAFPYVVRSGGMVNAFGPAMGHKAIHPETKDKTLGNGCFRFTLSELQRRSFPA